MFCKYCGVELSGGARFCPNCGSPAADSQSAAPILLSDAQAQAAVGQPPPRVLSPAASPYDGRVQAQQQPSGQSEPGRQSESDRQPQPTIVINNVNTSVNNSTNNNINIVNMGAQPPSGAPKNKWVAFLLCLFLGVIGAHKFYEGKIGMGVLYLFTGGLFGIGWLVDLIVLLTKPTFYSV